MTTTETRGIPLNQLAHCPENSRRVKPSAAEHAEMVASIRHHGLLENLVVRPVTDANGTYYEVVAGARRFEALSDLQKCDDIPSDHAVPCTVLTNGADVGEISLAENMVRVHMHPADQVEAFTRLHANGSTVEQIAARFGITDNVVQKRLRLGNVNPKLLKAYRDGEINLEALMAFTLTEDHKRQMAVFKACKEGYGFISPHAVKGMLSQEAIEATSNLAKYVTVAAYEKAGGAVSRDLFAEEHENGVYLDNAELVHSLALEKLEKTAVKLRKQWGWVDVMVRRGWQDTDGMDRIYEQRARATEEEQAEIDQIETKILELRKADEEADISELAERARAIKDGIRSRDAFVPEEQALAGCIVSVGGGGKIDVLQGLVKKEHRSELRKVQGKSDGTASSRDGMTSTKQAQKEAGLSDALTRDLASIRTAMVKTSLMEQPDVAVDLLTFQMARRLFCDIGWSGEALDLTANERAIQPVHSENDKDWSKSSPGVALYGKAVKAAKKAAGRSLSGDGNFASFRKLSPEAKQQILAACVAMTVNDHLSVDGQSPAELETAIGILQPAFETVRPKASVFWSRVSKPTMLGVLTDVIGEEYAGTQKAKKKSELADHMERLFADPSAGEFGLNKKAQDRVGSWAPMGFRAGTAK